jgi:hypothetical protein
VCVYVLVCECVCVCVCRARACACAFATEASPSVSRPTCCSKIVGNPVDLSIVPVVD